MANKTVLVWGHSLIRRMGQYCDEQTSTTNLGFRQDSHSIQMVGYSGGTIDTLRRYMGDIHFYRPDVICLQIAGNDLSRPELTPDVVFKNFTSLIEQLFAAPFVQYVVVFELFTRLRTRSHRGDVDIHVYNQRVKELNSRLSSALDGSVFCKFWRHDRMADLTRLYDSDGVHFKRQHPYFKSVRGGVLFGLKASDMAPQF
ncbi:hypothetical protein KP79_PYT06021 [Mizuhopecten yessoensis]|uniref:SGNH hydrolase-type esterase domain-containing protein n=1 Tax=Mizuhopecten yessoensis TaxID=6573 RepID=A0A210PJ60_MIZYE|nr:hypothetical protein KP79_PYT23012 [Mizuhopecten yessoensis]OWF37822.1 hypothetical protein KP79_PYT06021 [Mizuhopecten yessoensis]